MKNLFIILLGQLIINITLAQGNVGIGTTSPTAKLDVIGAIKITDGTQGVGKVLTSDANGRGSWQLVSIPPPASSDVPNYPAVNIGCATWMTKNLDVSTFRDGTTIPLVTNSTTWSTTTSAAYCYYSNAAGDTIYGKLYNWYAVNDPRGLAPEGWHIPSDFEWNVLVNTLGGDAIAGGMMKEMDTLRWNAPNLGATNLCNFLALPGGFRGTQGGFNVRGQQGFWWTCSKADADRAYSRSLSKEDTYISAAAADMNIGYSVRCVRD